MIDDELKCALVSQMWSDNIIVGRTWANVDEVVRRSAVPSHDAGRARDLLRAMVSGDAPVTTMSNDVVALIDDREAVRSYLIAHCLRESDLPWDIDL